MYGSQKALNMSRRAGSKGDLTGGGSFHYARSEVVQGGGNGYEPYVDGYDAYTFSKSSLGGGMMSGVSTGMVSGMGAEMSGPNLTAIHQRAMILQGQCQEYLKKAEYALQSGSGDAERFMGMAKETIDQLKSCAMDLRQMGQPNDNVVRTLEMCKDQLKGVHKAMTGTMTRRRSTRGSAGAWEEVGRSFQDAMGWIAQQKRLIETAPWGDDPAAIEQQLISHQKFHSSIQRSPEVDRARDDLIKKGDRGNLHALDQEWDSLQKLSYGRTQQLQELQQIIQEMSTEIMWVNDREEEELMFDWGDKNIDQYIPQKQESYSKLMSALEVKEKDLNKLKAKVDSLLKNNHPAPDKIEAYRDTLQTQWSWLLQITKCIDVHLKENAAYNQFFKEANETYSNLQKEHETVRKNFTCNKETSLEGLLELLRGLEREREKIMENKRQVQHLVNSSKNIVRLKPRNPEEKSSSPVIVKALCDFKQDQKVICKGNEAILKNNNQRSKWDITGPGGLDMLVPSVCLIIPPPNPLSVSLANKNEQYYEAILSIWNQLYINVKSLISWQYCLMDIRRINSLTISMLAKMRPEEYRQIIKSLETHFEEFKVSCQGSQMFEDEDKRVIENQYNGAQAHYDQLVVQLPVYIAQQEQIQVQHVAEQQLQPQLFIIQQQAVVEEDAGRLEEERRRMELKILAERKAEVKKEVVKKEVVKKEVVKKEQVVKKEAVKAIKAEPVKRKVLLSSSSASSGYSSSSRTLSELHTLRLRLESVEGTLSQHVHICLGDDGVHDCGLKITQLETVQRDIDSMREEYLRLREQILKELEDMNDADKAQFLRNEVGIINQRLGSLEGSSSAYLLRLRALRDMLESVARAEDIVKVYEARLTEKETTSLSPIEVDDYMLTLKNIKAELDQKKGVLASMEGELAKASHWNSQVGGPFHRCDMMLSKYSEQVGLLSDRWRRIQGQIDTRLLDLQSYHPQLQHYKQTSGSLIDWIDTTRKRQDVLQATKIDSIQALKNHISSQKALNSEIKLKRETVDSVLKDNEACVNSIRDYETDLASYTSGLETLLNIPIKRTMLKSPSMDLNQEATQLQTRYMELLTVSGDYHKFLGDLLKNMEELKIRNTRIDLLEEELRLLKEGIEDSNAKNKSLEDAIARYQLELSQSQDQLLSIEEVKQSTVLQCSATKESLDSTQGQLADLNDQVTRLNYLLEEEKRKRRLAEERYTQQQEEYDLVLRKRQKELEAVSWSKMEVEKSVANKDYEIEQLRRQLAEEAEKIKELQKEMSKVRSQCSMEINNLKLSYESQIHVSRTDIQRLAAQRQEDTAELQMQYDRMVAERRNLEEELRRLRMYINEAEEQRKRAEEEAQSHRAVITEEGRWRRELESQVEVLMRKRDEESSQYREELAEVMKSLQEKSEELAYITHSLEEETRRRRTIEEGQGVMEKTLTQLQVKLTSSSMAATQLKECEEELQKLRLELERESKERSRVEQNMSRLQGRMKDLQAVRDGLESQVENLRMANQEEMARRRQVEAELEKCTLALTEYSSAITTLRQSRDQASISEKRGEEERLRLQEELEKNLRQNKTSAERMMQLSAELKVLQQQLLQEQARVQETNLRNEGLYRTIEERSKALNENAVELQRLKELTDAHTKERLRLEEELRAARHDNEELLRSKQGSDDELSSQITTLELQLQASERNNVDYRNLVSELSSEREKLKLETEKIQNQASISEKRGAEERLRLQEELEKNLRQNKTSAERMTQLSAELKVLQQQLLQEQARVQEANLRNEGLYRTIEERSKALNENAVELQRLKELTEAQTKERPRLEEELRAARHDNEELLRSKQGSDDELSSQIAALELQLQASERSNIEYRNLVSELSSEREKLKLETEKIQNQASISEKRGEEECLRLQEELEKNLRQNKTSAERMTQLSAELKALQQQLLQEQARVKETNLRNEGLYRTIEERSKALNENAVELQRLKELTEAQTKERPRLEEELRAARHDNEELLRSKQGSDDELSSQIAALELQLQASERSNIEYRNLVSELSSEREKLKLETEKIQNQAAETTAMMQSIQSQHNDIVKERDALLLKQQLSGSDKDHFQRLEEELSRIKLSLESELRNKQRLQDENERVKRDSGYWKDQYDSKQGIIRQYDTDKDRLEREKNSLKSEIDRLMRELRELDETYKGRLGALQKELREVSVVRQTMETELRKVREPTTLDASTVIFDGVRKPVTANQLLDCGVLDKPTFSQLMKGHKTVPDVSVDKKVSLKGTGPIAGVVIEGPKSPGSLTGPLCKMTFAEAKKENLLPPDSVDLLLDAQAATGHIIDPRTNQKLTVEEACDQGVVDEEDRERLLAAEAAAVGYSGPGTSRPLSVFQAMKKGLIDKNTTLRLLQAQESVGGILDPILSVFLPKDRAIERNLIDDDIFYALNQRPELYLDPESEEGVTYMSMKRRCKIEPHTGLLLLPIPEKVDSSKIVFDGVRKPVTAKQLVDCGVLDKPTFKDLEKGKKTVPEVSVDKNVNLKGTGPIAGVVAGNRGKISLSEAKKQMLLPEDCADLLLEAQAATGHIIDPKTNQKLTVDEACARGVVDIWDQDRLLAAEAAAVGYKDPSSAKPLSVFEAMKKGVIDSNTGIRLLQAQESVGGILDPNLSVFLPKNTAIKRNLLDENLRQALNQSPKCYLDPETEDDASYEALKKRCKTEPHTGLLLLPITEKLDPSKLIFDGVRKPVTAQQLLDCGVLDKPTFNQLMKGEKTVPEVSVDKKVSLKGTGSIAGVAAGPLGKMSLLEAKKQMLIPPESADLLLDAQAATGHIIDPTSNQKLTVDEACARGVVDNRDRDRLLEAEAAAVGFRDPSTAKPLAVFEAMKKGVIDRKTALRLLQAQESAGGILDPNLSVFLPRDTAIKRNLLDEDLCNALNKRPEYYIDPDSELDTSYGALKKRSKTESHTGLILLPITERKDPSKLMFNGVRKPVSAQQLFECGVLDKPTFNQLVKGEKTVPEVSVEKKVYLKGTGPIAGVVAGRQGKISLSEAKKQTLLSPDCADLLLEAQAATGHIIDPETDQKLTVEEACARGVVDMRDRDRLLAAEAAAMGYKDPNSAKPLSVFEAMKKGVIDSNTGIRLLQAQESVGGILDPNLSVFLPKDTAIKHNLLDENLRQALKQSPKCYLDPETEDDASYGALKKRCETEPHTGLLLLPITEKLDPSKLLFDGVRKPVTAQQLLDCGVLDKPTFNQLMKGEKTVPEVSVDKKVFLKGTGSIAGVAAGPLGKMSLLEAKKQMLMPPESADLLLDAQAATGHIIDPTSNQKLTVDEACARGVVDNRDRDRLLEAEAAAVGFRDPSTAKPLAVFEAMNKGVIDRKTALRLLQAQESAGGILDPNLSVFLPRDTAIKRNLLDEDLCNALNKRPEYYIDPDTELDTSYGALKKRSKTESHTGLILLPITERKDPSKLMFNGVRKPVSAQQLFECGVLDKPTFNQLVKGEKTVPEVSVEKKVYLKGTGPIAGVVAGRQGKISLSDTKKRNLLSPDCADLLLEAQAATGHIIDPETDQKFTVEEACARGVVDMRDRDRLLAAEAAAVGYKDPSSTKPLSVFEAMKKGVIDRKTGIRLLQAQESVGGILDPNLSVFLPKDTAIKHNLLDENLRQALKQSPKCYLDPETEDDASYGALKKRCETEPHTGLLLLPITEKLDPSKLLFDGVRKPVTAQQLLDCGVLDKPTFNQLIKGEKTVPEVSVDKKVFLKGTGSIAGVAAGPLGKMSLLEAKKQMLMPPESADLLLDAQAATGHIIDPTSNEKLTVDEACARGVVDNRDRDRLLEAEAAAVGYRDPRTAKPLAVFEAMKKGVIDRKTALRLLQAQESAGGILDPNLSVFLPRDTAIKRNLLDEDLCNALNERPEYYIDPDTELDTRYGALKKRSKTESHTGLILLPITERKDPSKLMFNGVRKPVSAQQLFECGVLDKPTFNQLVKGEKTVPEVSVEKKVYLKGTGPIAGVVAGRQGKISLSEAKKQMLLSPDCADLLLEAQAATGHIIDPETDQKLTVEEACARGVVDMRDRERLLAAEAAAVGYKDPNSAKPLSVFEAMKKGVIDSKTGIRLLQAQESVGGILDPNLSVFLPKDTAIKHNLLDENLSHALKQNPASYLDPETEHDVSYGALKERCKTEPHTGLQLLPVSVNVDPSNLFFNAVRKTVTAQQLLDCGILDKITFDQLMKGEKTVPEVAVAKKVFLKGTGSIAGVAAGPLGKMSLFEAKKQMLMPPESADSLLDAQAATGHIIDPTSNQKLTVDEACARGVVDNRDRDRLLEAEAAAVGFRDPSTAKPLAVFEAMKKGVIDRKTALRLLQAQESAGGILDPNLSVFLPRDTAIKRNLLDEDLCSALNKRPEYYIDPDTELDTSYEDLKKRSKTESHTGLILLPITERKDPSKLMFNGVRKPVSAQQLFECGVLDKPTFDQLVKGEKTVPEVSVEKKVYLKGTGPIAGVVAGRQGKVSLSDAKKRNLLSPDCADLLLEAQAATGHIIDPETDQTLTVEEACARGMVDMRERDRLLAAEAAAVGYKDPRSAKPLSVFEAMKKGVIDSNTGIRLLQAQESVGGILDPNLSVFLPKDTAIKQNLLDENLRQALNQSPKCYLDPETEQAATYGALKKRCKTEPHTGMLLLPITEKVDPSNLLFDGVRKPVTAQQLLDRGVLDKPTFNQLVKGEKTVPEVSVEKKVYLKGTGPIAGVVAGRQGKMSLSEAKKRQLLSPDCADLLLEAQAATGRITDPETDQKLTVEEACARGVVDMRDRDRLLAAEAAAVGYKDPSSAKPLSVFEAMKKGVIDSNTGLRLLQAQESVGGILDPNLSVFLPKDTAIKQNLLDENLRQALNQSPKCYLDPETEQAATYGALKKRCKTEPHTGLLLLPITEKVDPSNLLFDGVRKPVTAQQLLDRGVLDKPTFNQLVKGEKTVPEVSVEKKVYLKGTGPIAGVVAGRQGKMSLSEAKKRQLLSPDCADLLLEAQAATGRITDPETDQKLTVEEACARGVVDMMDRDRLLAAEAAAVGYKDPSSAKPLSVFEAMKKGVIDSNTGIRLLQAQESVGGILDPNLSVFLPKDTAIKQNLLDENLRQALNQSPKCYLDPETEQAATYGALKKRCKTEPHTGLLLLPITEKVDPSSLLFDGVCKTVTAQQLLDRGVLDKPTFNQLVKGEKTVPEVSVEKKVYLKGTGPIAGVVAGHQGKISLSEAKKRQLLSPDCADLLLEAQAATGLIIDPETDQKLTVEEACARGVVDMRARERLLAAEAAAVGYKDPNSAKPLSVFEAMKKGVIDSNTGIRLLQAQESVGGILDPNLSVFLPKDTAIKHNLLDENVRQALNQSPKCYLDPETEQAATYGALKKRCKTEPHTGLLLLPITEKVDPSNLLFDGVCKKVTAQQLLDRGVLDKPTFNQLVKGEKTVPEVSVEKKVYLKGTGPIAGVVAGRQGKISLSEAKKRQLLSSDCADLLLEAQAATGHIIDPKTDQKFTVEEACARGVVDMRDRERLLAAEAAAVGYKDPNSAKPLSVFEAMKKGVIDRMTGIRLLQAQESVGGILDPNLSMFLPNDTAIKQNLLDGNVRQALNQSPKCYLDPDTEQDVTYGALKKRCKTEPHTGLLLLPITEKVDPSSLLFDGVCKTVTAQQLLDCGVLDRITFDQLMKGEKTVPEVTVDIKVFLKGTGSIAGVAAGPLRKMSFTEAKKHKIMSSDSADMLLEAQAATGLIIDPRTNQKIPVKEACARGIVDKEDESKLFVAEAAAIGYRDPNTGKILSAGQAMKMGFINKDTALRILQAQQSVGGILDPALGVFLPKDIAMKRDLIDEDLYQALNQCPKCYLDPDTQQTTTYVSLKTKCKADPSTGLLLLPEPTKPITVQGLRGQVPVIDLVDANLLERSDMEKLREGRLTSQDIEDRLRSYLRGSTCIAGVYDEASDKVMPIYQAMKDGLLRPGTTLELLEAQAASGFIVDPVNNLYLTVSDAYNKRLFGPEFKDKLLSAEKAVTGYKLPGTDKTISLFQAIDRGLVEKGHGIRLLEAQIASGGIIDPEHSHRIDVNVAYKRGYFDEKTNNILTDQGVDTKGFFDPNTEENLTYLELKERCITDETGLILLPIMDKKKQESILKNTLRKRRVVIVDPDTNKEMTVREAYDKGYIDYETFLELSEQECEWEEITITDPDGSTRFVIIDKKTGRQFDITELLEKQVINQSDLDQYKSRAITLTQFADRITSKTRPGSSAASGTSSATSSTSRTSASLDTSSMTSSSTFRTSEVSVPSSVTSSSLSSSVLSRPRSPSHTMMTTTRTTTVTERSDTVSGVSRDSPGCLRNISSVSITLASPVETIGEQEPVGAIFDTETLEKISITEALNRGLVDSITAQRLLEAQACTGGIINPTNGKRFGIQEASRLGIITDDMATKLKPAQKAYIGFEDVKTRRKMSLAEAMKERWLPYEAGQRFMEFQFVTGGLYDPQMGCRRTLEDALKMEWLDVRAAHKLQDISNHTKNLTCPKSKLKISYKEALDDCLAEESTGVKMLQASSVSSRGISSPYNVSSAPGSTTGSRSGSRRSSRRSSVDLGSPTSSTTHYSHSSSTTFLSTYNK